MFDETYVVPAGIGSPTTTLVSASGPLFVTTIVHVMSWYVPLNGTSWVFGEPVFVIERSVMPSIHVVAVHWPWPSFVVVTKPVLLTTPVSGHSPPLPGPVVDVMWTVNVLAS